MIHLVDDVLREEARRYALAFTCRRCVQFDEDGETCSLGYPNAPHKDVDLDRAAEVTFCKAFELW